MRYIKKTNFKNLKRISKTFRNTSCQHPLQEATSIQKKSSNPVTSSADWLKEIVEEGEIALVIWQDAETNGGPECVEAEDIHQSAFSDICIIHSVGYILSNTKVSISLCDTIQVDGTAGGAVHTIPKGMVQEVHILGLFEEESTNDLRPHDGNKVRTSHGEDS